MSSPILSRKVLLLVLVGSLMFNVGVGATMGVRTYRHYCEREDAGGRRPGKGMWGPRRFFEELNLSAEQRQQADVLRQELHKQLRDAREALAREGEQLAELIAAEVPDREAIDDSITVIGELRTQIQRAVVDHLLALKDVLDPVQHAAATELLGRLLIQDRGMGAGFRRGERGGPEHRGPGRGPGAPLRGNDGG